MNMGELHVELHRRSLRMGNSQKYQTSGVHDARHLISWTDRSAIRVREHPDTATCLAARFFHLAKANTNTPAKCQLYVRSHAHGEMPTLRAITRTRRNATPFALPRNRFPGPGCIGLLGYTHLYLFYGGGHEHSSTKNYLYVTFVTPVLCSYTLSAQVLHPAEKQLTIKCTDLVLLVH